MQTARSPEITQLAPIGECAAPDAPSLVDLVEAAEPIVLRGLVDHWPAVAAVRSDSLPDYLRRFDRGTKASCVVGPSEIAGCFFYRPDLSGFNFSRRPASVSDVVDQLARQANKAEPLAIAMQSAALDGVLPGFADANALPLLPPEVRPRIWIGNAIRVATHYDSNDNIACVVSGRRRFTLFPPDQLPNMYVGPLEATPAGAPVSMVDPDAPDLDRFPRFADALAHARVAELGPGDAIFIPYFWWHAVRSLDPLSVLVNYWWNDWGSDRAPLNAMLHAILAMKDLPPARRAIWRGMFEQLVFEVNGAPATHLPEHVRGVFGPLGPDERRNLAEHLASGLRATGSRT